MWETIRVVSCSVWHQALTHLCRNWLVHNWWANLIMTRCVCSVALLTFTSCLKNQATSSSLLFFRLSFQVCFAVAPVQPVLWKTNKLWKLHEYIYLKHSVLLGPRSCCSKCPLVIGLLSWATLTHTFTPGVTYSMSSHQTRLFMVNVTSCFYILLLQTVLLTFRLRSPPPPAIVRPKSDADDDQPVEVEPDKKEQVVKTLLNVTRAFYWQLQQVTKKGKRSDIAI